jgi:upstream activation factor subunit UAF30
VSNSKENKGKGQVLICSDALSALVGEAQLSRPQTVKRIWEYIKERDLQDPKDKRHILCDDTMKAVFHTDRLHMFT